MLTELGHFGHCETGKYYNGYHHDDVLKGDHLGIDHWSKRGGIVGRGVLLDYVAYAARHNITYDPMTRYTIPLSALKEIAKEQGTTFVVGDILIVRSGWVKWYEEHSPEERRAKIRDGNTWLGVEGSEEVCEWIWNNHFSAIAGDAIGFEAWPPQAPYRKSSIEIFLEIFQKTGLNVDCRYSRSCSCILGNANWRTLGFGGFG